MYENIAKNRAKTALLIIVFVFFISLIGYFIGVYFDYRYGFGSAFSVINACNCPGNSIICQRRKLLF